MNTFLQRGKKFIASAAHRGAKFVQNLPQHLKTLDETSRKAATTLNKAAEFANVAGNEFGNKRLIEAGGSLQKHGTSIQNIRHGATANLARNVVSANEYWTPST